MTAAVDIYSGRENPEYPLSDAAAQDLAEHLQALSEAGGSANSAEERPALGFRGFILGGELDGFEDAEVSVDPDGVSIDRGDEPEWIADGGVAYEIVLDDLDGSLSPEEDDARRDAGR